jgi:hypothetical protein
MRVQRAPRAAEQPQRPPEGVVRRDPRPVATVRPTGGEARGTAFTAEVDLDLTRLAERAPEELLAEVVVRLVVACHREGLVDDASALRVVVPSDRGLVGARVEQAVGRSAHAVGALLRAVDGDLPVADAGTLTVVDARAVRVRAAGDWGLGGGIGVATLGGIASTVVSHRRPAGLVLGERRSAPLALAVPDGERAHAVVRALEAVARSVEQPVS